MGRGLIGTNWKTILAKAQGQDQVCDRKTYTHGCGFGREGSEVREQVRVLEVEILRLSIDFAGAWR